MDFNLFKPQTAGSSNARDLLTAQLLLQQSQHPAGNAMGALANALATGLGASKYGGAIDAQNQEKQQLAKMLAGDDPKLQYALQYSDPESLSKAIIDRQYGESPSAVREYEYFNKLDPKAQESFLNVKRAQQTLNLGGSQAVLSPSGGIRESYPVTPKPEDMPGFKESVKKAEKRGEREGEAQGSLAFNEAKLPQLKQTVLKLRDLGKNATYTTTGKIADFLVKEAGPLTGKLATRGAVARSDYIATVDNEVLPLLRDTFGAAFTQKEGESLKATLGDTDKSPPEKQAVLEAFIANKIENIQSLKRQTSVSSNPSVDSGDGWSVQEVP